MESYTKMEDVSKNELVHFLAMNDLHRKCRVDFAPSIGLRLASRYLEAKTPESFNSWVDLTLRDQENSHIGKNSEEIKEPPIKDCYRLSHCYDNLTSISVYNPTDIEFRMFLSINGIKIITFYDVSPGHNVFELGMNALPMYKIPFNQLYLLVRRKDSELKYLTYFPTKMGPLDPKSVLLQTKARVEFYDIQKRDQRLSDRKPEIMFDEHYGIHVIMDGEIVDSHHLGKDVELLLP